MWEAATVGGSRGWVSFQPQRKGAAHTKQPAHSVCRNGSAAIFGPQTRCDAVEVLGARNVTRSVPATFASHPDREEAFAAGEVQARLAAGPAELGSAFVEGGVLVRTGFEREQTVQAEMFA